MSVDGLFKGIIIAFHVISNFNTLLTPAFNTHFFRGKNLNLRKAVVYLVKNKII